MYNWNKTLVLVRGLPGSGKTTYANNEKDNYSTLVEADDYRTYAGGYHYHESQNQLAHSWCFAETFRRMQFFGTVFVANVFQKREFIFPYIEQARKLEVKVFIESPTTAWAKDVDVLTRKNTHGVPEEVIQKMIDGWEEFTQKEVDILLNRY